MPNASLSIPKKIKCIASIADNIDQAMNLLLMQGAVYAPPSSAVIATRIAATRVCL
jgi:hypothetical protein